VLWHEAAHVLTLDEWFRQHATAMVSETDRAIFENLADAQQPMVFPRRVQGATTFAIRAVLRKYRVWECGPWYVFHNKSGDP
jgi:hypothetical protein